MVGAVLIPAVKKYLAAGLFAVRFFELYVPIFFLFFPLDFYLQVCYYYPELGTTVYLLNFFSPTKPVTAV